jgi:hypothetical protein
VSRPACQSSLAVEWYGGRPISPPGLVRDQTDGSAHLRVVLPRTFTSGLRVAPPPGRDQDICMGGRTEWPCAGERSGKSSSSLAGASCSGRSSVSASRAAHDARPPPNEATTAPHDDRGRPASARPRHDRAGDDPAWRRPRRAIWSQRPRLRPGACDGGTAASPPKAPISWATDPAEGPEPCHATRTGA